MGNNDTEYVLVTEYFHPDTASTGQLLTDLAVGLQDRGLDMTVYTGQPNYHSGENPKQPVVSLHEGVLIYRIRAPQMRQTSLFRRGFNWIVFTFWMFLRLLISRPEREREIIFVSNPPFLPPVMWLVCRLRGWEYTYIVNDVYPDSAIITGYLSANGVVARCWRAIHKHVFADAKHVVVHGPAVRDHVLSYGGEKIDTDQVEVIYYWEDETFIQPLAKDDNWFAREHDLLDTFTVIYSGNIGVHHDLETLVCAAAELDDEPLTVLIIGDGDRKAAIETYAETLGVAGGTVRFLPYQDKETLPYSLTAGDVSVVSVREGMKGVCVSCKIYTGMAAGTPILVISEPSDDEETIVTRHDAGLHAAPGDVDAVVDAIKTWMNNSALVTRQSENARNALERRYTKDHSLDQYYALLTD